MGKLTVDQQIEPFYSCTNITHRSVSGVEYITTLWMTPLSVKVLPDGFPEETHSGFNISSSGAIILFLMDSI